jgi:hypothetical protein
VTNFGQKIILLFKKITNKNFCLERINILAGMCGKIAVANCHKNNKIKSVKILFRIKN